MARIYPLSEGTFTIGHDKLFVPFSDGEHELNERPTGSLLVEVQPFLVVTGKDVILLDTGLGFNNKQGSLQLHANIRACGYEPAQVTKVLLSHLHKDHAGGVSFKDGNGIVKPSLEHAMFYVYRAEADYALKEGFPSYIPEELEPLLGSGQVAWLDDSEGIIGDGVRYWHSGGHCPEHIVFLIEDGGDRIFFGGDEAPQLKQMKMKYIAKYDFDGKRAMQLREEFAARGREDGWQFLFYHDVKKPVATL